MTRRWRVVWSSDFAAETPRQAAEAAEDYIREHGVHCFEVTEHARTSRTHFVDLDEEAP